MIYVSDSFKSFDDGSHVNYCEYRTKHNKNTQTIDYNRFSILVGMQQKNGYLTFCMVLSVCVQQKEVIDKFVSGF